MLISNVVLTSEVQQSDLVTHTHTHIILFDELNQGVLFNLFIHRCGCAGPSGGVRGLGSSCCVWDLESQLADS